MTFFWYERGGDWVFGPDPYYGPEGHWRLSVSIPYRSYAECLTAYRAWMKRKR